MKKVINNFDDDWFDIQCGGEVKNIRAKGSYPNVQHKKHIHFKSHHHPYASMFLMNQHKPYGLATVGLLDPFDDRPDWFLFHKKHRKRVYDEITPDDPESFYQAMEQDHDMNIPHNHVHIQERLPENNPSEEIEDTVII